MILSRTRKAQSILEYALLLGVIAAGILIMQSFIKRGFQGNLKDSADRMGDQFSASNTRISRSRTMDKDSPQVIVEEAGTSINVGLSKLALPDVDVIGATDKKAYSFSSRTGGKSTSTNKQATDAVTQEAYKWGDYQTTKEDDLKASW